MTDTWLKLCLADDVPAGAALKVETEGLTLAVFNLDGRFFVIDDQCTHGPGSLSEGYVDGDEIECNFHQGRFHIPTGAVAGPPCMIPVQCYATEVIAGSVCIDPTPKPLAYMQD